MTREPLPNIPMAERIRERMKETGIGPGELSDKLHVTPGMVNHYMTGKRIPSLATLLVLAKVLKCSSDYLLGLRDKNKPSTDKPSMQ